jgi:NADH dehydrogenase
VGAGFTGIELALELRERVSAHTDAVVGEQLEIHLYDRAPFVGPELGASPRAHIERALSAARVRLHLGADICSLGRDGLSLADGQAMNYGAVVLTTGMKASSFTRCIPVTHDDLGRILVDRTLRAPAVRHIYVAGDAAAAATLECGPLALQSCQHALQMGRFAGDNAARDLLGLPSLLYEQPRYITCLDLGRSGALWTEGWTREVTISGKDAKVRKRRINRLVIYPPPIVSPEWLLALSSTDQEVQGQVRSEYESMIAEAQ